jgi:hypothetical protein
MGFIDNLIKKLEKVRNSYRATIPIEMIEDLYMK